MMIRLFCFLYATCRWEDARRPSRPHVYGSYPQVRAVTLLPRGRPPPDLPHCLHRPP